MGKADVQLQRRVTLIDAIMNLGFGLDTVYSVVVYVLFLTAPNAIRKASTSLKLLRRNIQSEDEEESQAIEMERGLGLRYEEVIFVRNVKTFAA